MKNEFKHQSKGFIAGVLATSLIGAGLLTLEAQQVTRQISFGVNLNVDGQLLQLPQEDRPFIMDGRTFLPVRAIAEALGTAVDWNGQTATVYIGQIPHIVHTTVTHLFNTPHAAVGNAAWLQISGTENNNTIRLSGPGYSRHRENYVVYNLSGGLNATLSGTFLTPNRDTATNVYRIYGNGRLLYETPVIAGSNAERDFEIDISGIIELRIESVFNGNGSSTLAADGGIRNLSVTEIR